MFKLLYVFSGQQMGRKHWTLNSISKKVSNAPPPDSHELWWWQMHYVGNSQKVKVMEGWLAFKCCKAATWHTKDTENISRVCTGTYKRCSFNGKNSNTYLRVSLKWVNQILEKKGYIKPKNHLSKKTLIQLFYNIITRDNKCLTATKMCFYVILKITLSL